MEVLGQERRRRWSVEEKLAMVRESLESGQSVLVVARRNGVNPNQLFHWRKLYQDGKRTGITPCRRIPSCAAAARPERWPSASAVVSAH
ncbi:transposase, partial [Pseudomonas aeruginosa]|uniref:transposase n=1 Tax=Pseudomonas aeruginosa TaxID=287 RepID=UPI001EE0CBED